MSVCTTRGQIVFFDKACFLRNINTLASFILSLLLRPPSYFFISSIIPYVLLDNASLRLFKGCLTRTYTSLYLLYALLLRRDSFLLHFSVLHFFRNRPRNRPIPCFQWFDTIFNSDLSRDCRFPSDCLCFCLENICFFCHIQLELGLTWSSTKRQMVSTLRHFVQDVPYRLLSLLWLVAY